MFKCRIKPQSPSNIVIRAIVLSGKVNYQVLKGKKELPRGVEHGWRDRHNFFTQLWKDNDALLSFLPWWSLKLGIPFILLSVHTVISAQGSMGCHSSDKVANNTTVEICFPFNPGQSEQRPLIKMGLKVILTLQIASSQTSGYWAWHQQPWRRVCPPDSLPRPVRVFTRHKRRQPDKCIKTWSYPKAARQKLCVQIPPGDCSLI